MSSLPLSTAPSDTALATQAEDERWMRRCLQLARQGELTTAPNPMVGAVIVYGTGADARILGEGYHLRPGEGHAEVLAFRAVRPEDRPLLAESTIYVTLEPCSHYGRTPPCSALIIKNKVKRCVIGSEDPFRKVCGRGIAMLQEAGIEVTVGVLREECIYLNRKFFCQNVLRRPFITLKWAATSDGFIDRSRSLDENGEVSAAPLRLSSPSSLLRVHHFRATHQAILVAAKPSNSIPQNSMFAAGQVRLPSVASWAVWTNVRFLLVFRPMPTSTPCSKDCVATAYNRFLWKGDKPPSRVS